MLQTQSKSSDLIPLIAFKPRQIMLSNTNMKKHHNSQEVCSQNASAHKLAPNLKPHQKLAPTLKPHQNTLLLHSISHFLQRNGFSKTLKKFRSEAKLDQQNDGWKGCLLSLEEMYFKCLETSSANTNFDSYKEQDLEIDGITKKDEDNNCVASVETVSKKKKKRSDGSDSNAVVDQPQPAETLNNTKNLEETLTNDLIPESNVKSKERKKNKKSFDTAGQGNEQVSSEVLKVPADDIACEQQLDESSKKCKDKKKKRSKLVSESLVDNAEHHQLEALSGMMEENPKDLVSLEGKSTTDFDINNKSKDKKRKRDKLSYDSQVFNSTMDNTCEIPSEEKNVKSKSKKRKKDGLVSESLPGGDMEELDSGKLRTDSKKDNFQNLDEDATSKEKKGSKKIKRLASEGGDSQPINKVAIDECKHRKTEGLEESKTSEQLMKVNASLGNDGHADNKSKDEIDKVGFNDAQKTPIKQLDTQENGNLERNGEKYAVQKTLKKQHNGSVEPKTVNAFQRVKIDEVVFVDEKLQDNSYWAKDGAEIGYGAKAQEVLGQVRGRDFRHEKTKKKRGSYRGGQIDLQSHSVKFNYSDEE